MCIEVLSIDQLLVLNKPIFLRRNELIAQEELDIGR